MNIMLKICLMLSLIALIQAAKMQRIQIHKDPKALKSMDNVIAMQEFTTKKYRNFATNTQAAEEVDKFNATYYGYIYIGTPPQKQKVIFDTYMTSIVAVPSQYNPADSKSAIAFDNYYYVQDPVSSDSFESNEMYTDIVQLGDIHFNWKIPIITGLGEYGRFGLSHTWPAGQGVIRTIYKDGLISKDLFSMYLVNEATSASAEYAGEIIFGGSDASAYAGELTYFNLTNPDTSYMISVDHVVVAGKTVGSKFDAYIDSGTNFIATPILPYDLINQKLGGYIDANGTFILDCNTVDSLPNVDITIAGQTISLPPSAYVLNIFQDDGDMICISAFYHADSWIFGMPFFANNYIEFDLDNNRIGIAPAAAYSGSSSVNVPLPQTIPLPKKICKSTM